jgi:hypothetical protein
LIDGFLLFFLTASYYLIQQLHIRTPGLKKIRLFLGQNVFLKSGITPLNSFISWLYYPFQK